MRPPPERPPSSHTWSAGAHGGNGDRRTRRVCEHRPGPCVCPYQHPRAPPASKKEPEKELCAHARTRARGSPASGRLRTRATLAARKQAGRFSRGRRQRPDGNQGRAQGAPDRPPHTGIPQPATAQRLSLRTETRHRSWARKPTCFSGQLSKIPQNCLGRITI